MDFSRISVKIFTSKSTNNPTLEIEGLRYIEPVVVEAVVSDWGVDFIPRTKDEGAVLEKLRGENEHFDQLISGCQDILTSLVEGLNE